MAYRLLRSMVRIWDHWQAAHPRARALPVIVPLVLYHGDAPWTAPRSFEALLEIPPSLGPAVRAYMPRFSYLVDDLSIVSPARPFSRKPS